MRLRSVSALIGFSLYLTSAFTQERVVTTIAGTDWLFPGDGRPAINAPLGGSNFGLDVAVDHNGNLFICDGDNLMVMRVGPDGLINVIAGNGVNFASGDGGLAVNAGLTFPTAIAVDSSGNVYIAELLNTIRKVTPNGIITKIAGTGESGFGGDNGPATQALLNSSYGLAVDAANNVYVADTYNNRIRKITPDGIITTIAGNGERGKSGDNGPAISAQLNQPTRITLDPAGNLYIAEVLNQRVRKIDTHGVITTFAGGSPDPREFLQPVAVAADLSGNVYIADLFSAGILKVDTQGRMTTIAGGSGTKGFSGDGGPALKGLLHFFFHSALAVDPVGNVFAGDDGNGRIREITSDNTINTIAGNGLFHFSGNGGPATSATLDNPTSVVADSAGNIYITEQLLSRIRRITPDGTINVLAGNGASGYSGDNGPAISAALSHPSYLTFDPNGNLYFSDSLNGVIRRIDANGIITTYAGNGHLGFSGDGGPATQATFLVPSGIDFDSAGELIIADGQNNRIRAVLPSGDTPSSICNSTDSCVITLAGDGNPGFSGDNGPSTRAEVSGPVGVRVYNDAIYFADSDNNRIRKIDIGTLTITTVAGNGQAGYSGDGGPATLASLNNPQAVVFDGDGNMYIADTRNSRVRKVTPDGTISTFIGIAKKSIFGDGGPLSTAGVGGPTDIFVDSSRRILVADSFFNRIRAVLTNPPSFQVNPGSLAFTAAAGSNPIDQRLDLVGSIPGVVFNASANPGNWLQASPAAGAMPATLRITVDPSKLSAGSYQGAVTISAPNSQPTTKTIPVALTVTAAGQPSLNLNPASMTFSFVQQSPARTRPLAVSNAGGGSLAFTVAAATSSGGSWLSASPSGGSVNAFASTSVNITADPTGLAPGTYSGTVTASSASPSQSVIVPVTMTITSVPQTILIPQTGLSFFAVQGGGPASPQFFSILNTGRGQMPFTTSASTLSGGSWLAAFPGSGVSDADSPIVPQVRVDANPANLATGIYYGTVQVSAPGADNNPQFVSIILNVLPPGSNIGPIVQPTGLIFAGVAGADPPGSQTVLVQSTSDAPVTFRSGRLTVDGQNWFTSLPPDATITQAQPVRIVVQPQTAGLAPAIYRGTLTLSFSDGSTRSVAIILVLVPPGASLPPAGQAFRVAQSSCTPTTLAPLFTQLSNNFSVPAGFPGQVTVKVIDDCANPQTSGGVTAVFSNGNPALRLISLKDGTWAGTWTPQRATSQITVTANAEIPEQNLKGQVQITGGLKTFDQPPSIGTGAVLNAASLSLQSPIAPGSLITISGSKLAQSQASASDVPLPTTLAGTSILLAGRQTPLLFASDGQVNAVVPYGIAVNTAQQVIVSQGSSLSVPQSITMAAAGPGIFTSNGIGKGQGWIFGADASGVQTTLADSANPVKAGDTIIIYCTGLGEVSPPVTAGTPAPQLSSTVNAVAVTIGGAPANVLFSGLVPAKIGLYQINAVVPGGVAAGDQVPVVATAAGQSSPAVTIAVR